MSLIVRGVGGLLECQLAAQATLNGYEKMLRLAGRTKTADLLRDRALNDVNSDDRYRWSECLDDNDPENNRIVEVLALALRYLQSGYSFDFLGYGANYNLENLEGMIFRLSYFEGRGEDYDRENEEIRRVKGLIFDQTEMSSEIMGLIGDLNRTMNRPQKA
jgi:hypothetical protein